MLINFHPTTVVNVTKRPYDVYIGRGSKWGNPYVIGRDGDRNEVIRKYELYLKGQPALIAALPELWGQTLGCHCHPLPCHGHILKRYADEARKAQWDATEFMPIKGFKDQYRFLSNFYPARIVINGQHYRSSEHAYQAAKTLDRDWRERIAECRTPGEAKRLGNKAPKRSDWDTIRLDIMKLVVEEKFKGSPALQRMLLSTGKAPLEETNHWNDTFWGVCKGKGTNHLGQILMDVRAMLHVRPVRLIVAGTRTFWDYPVLKAAFEDFLQAYSNYQVKIISGMAEGADTLGIELAKEYCLPVVEMPAAWDIHGKSAGYKRNAEMAKRATHLLAMWDGKSRGTSHMINLAGQAKLTTKVVQYAV